MKGRKVTKIEKTRKEREDKRRTHRMSWVG